MQIAGTWHVPPGSTILFKVEKSFNAGYTLTVASEPHPDRVFHGGLLEQGVQIRVVENHDLFFHLTAAPERPYGQASLKVHLAITLPDGTLDVDVHRMLEFDEPMLWKWIVLCSELPNVALDRTTDFYRPMPRPVQPEAGVERVEMDQDAQRPRSRKSRARVVNTGFSTRSAPGRSLPRSTPLGPGRPYYYWLAVGPPVAGSIEVAPQGLPVERLPRSARLTVALFSSKGQIGIERQADTGEIQIEEDGSARVLRQPGEVGEPRGGPKLLLRRLLFPVNAPYGEGTYSLRCNIYHEQVLVQSRRITARVGGMEEANREALASRVEYCLSSRLDGGHLSRMAAHSLSLMLNASGEGTHDIHVMGAQGIKGTASFQQGAIGIQIAAARGALRVASWGHDQEAVLGDVYRYDGPPNIERLREDLARFAVWGYRFYDVLMKNLENNQVDTARMSARMRDPSLVQIVMKESPPQVLPAAMIYDYPIDDTLELEEVTLCPAFVSDLQQERPLEEAACFQGRCPTASKLTVVCPGGFWGYRHELGMPMSTAASGEDSPIDIPSGAGPEVIGGMSTDPTLVERDEHLRVLGRICPVPGPQLGTTRDQTIEVLVGMQPRLVYFYCHGGLEKKIPFIQVGPTSEHGITPSNLRAFNIKWPRTHPLVFINGCHTTALDPESAFDLLSAFVQTAHASGVIGTEISVFERLARAFSEEFMRHFFRDEPVGRAVRKTRLVLLKAMNPLGLVYVPFVRSDLARAGSQSRGVGLSASTSQADAGGLMAGTAEA